MEPGMSDKIEGYANGPGDVMVYPRAEDLAGQKRGLVTMSLHDGYCARFLSKSLSRDAKATITPDTLSTRDRTRSAQWHRHKALLLAWDGICGKEGLPGA
jgi:hypothetical protein